MQRMYQDLLTVILHICGIQRTFETIMSVSESKASDPHVNKEREMNGFNKK